MAQLQFIQISQNIFTPAMSAASELLHSIKAGAGSDDDFIPGRNNKLSNNLFRLNSISGIFRLAVGIFRITEMLREEAV
ncbi:hypothetical protein J2125_004195 [Erwinia toletana]|uniref:Uncharacterized protein n=1 Tax=Winslowiella toletana TaxID=92490 RepID=A0ABS4PEE1_9GAMM|nr:hypothetical protein [Winslowiella toletana]